MLVVVVPIVVLIVVVAVAINIKIIIIFQHFKQNQTTILYFLNILCDKGRLVNNEKHTLTVRKL